MIPTMSRAAVLMAPPSWFRRKQIVDGRGEILITPGAHLDHGQTGSGVRHENRQQAGLELGTKPGEVRCDIENTGSAARVDDDFFADHLGSIRLQPARSAAAFWATATSLSMFS